QEVFYIVPEKCTECVGFHDQEACAAVCPVDVCIPNPDIPESEEVLLQRAKELHPDVQFPPDFPSRFHPGRGGDGAAAPAPAGGAPAGPAPPPPPPSRARARAPPAPAAAGEAPPPAPPRPSSCGGAPGSRAKARHGRWASRTTTGSAASCAAAAGPGVERARRAAGECRPS